MYIKYTEAEKYGLRIGLTSHQFIVEFRRIAQQRLRRFVKRAWCVKETVGLGISLRLMLGM